MHLSTAIISTLLMGSLTACNAAALTKRQSPNIVKNGNFEAAQPVWRATPGNIKSKIEFQADPQIRSQGGVVYGFCNASWAVWPERTDSVSIDQTVAVTPNSRYRVSLQVYGFFDASKLKVMWNDQEVTHVTFDMSPGMPKISAWSPVSGTINIGPGETRGNLKIVWFCEYDRALSVYVDNVSMVKL